MAKKKKYKYVFGLYADSSAIPPIGELINSVNVNMKTMFNVDEKLEVGIKIAEVSIESENEASTMYIERTRRVIEEQYSKRLPELKILVKFDKEKSIT
jgi:hypothetical protein